MTLIWRSLSAVVACLCQKRAFANTRSSRAMAWSIAASRVSRNQCSQAVMSSLPGHRRTHRSNIQLLALDLAGTNRALDQSVHLQIHIGRFRSGLRISNQPALQQSYCINLRSQSGVPRFPGTTVQMLPSSGLDDQLLQISTDVLVAGHPRSKPVRPFERPIPDRRQLQSGCFGGRLPEEGEVGEVAVIVVD